MAAPAGEAEAVSPAVDARLAAALGALALPSEAAGCRPLALLAVAAAPLWPLWPVPAWPAFSSRASEAWEATPPVEVARRRAERTPLPAGVARRRAVLKVPRRDERCSRAGVRSRRAVAGAGSQGGCAGRRSGSLSWVCRHMARRGPLTAAHSSRACARLRPRSRIATCRRPMPRAGYSPHFRSQSTLSPRSDTTAEIGSRAAQRPRGSRIRRRVVRRRRLCVVARRQRQRG